MMRSRQGIFHAPACRRASLLDVDTFYFLNQSGDLSIVGWDAIGGTDYRTKLWRYHQHYFDDLNAANAAERRDWHLALLERWVVENAPGTGVGWDPYPTSLRIVNWVKWHYSTNALPVSCVESLAIQSRWMMKRIEWHILGNHLFSNAKALVFAGVFFSGKEADVWLQQGLNIIADELPEQVLFDGGNFERSPMYHAIFLEDLLDLVNLAWAFPGVIPEAQVLRWIEASQRMIHWLDGMTHPDGEIGFFNDAAVGITPSPSELMSYARRLGVPFFRVDARVTNFDYSGFVRLSVCDALVLLDVGKIGPDYLPAHAHADTLSFELSLFGHRVVVNGGTSQYGTGIIRQLERGTAAHSTVVVNYQNSSEVWGGFRVARRAYPRDLVIEETAASVVVTCAHDGYRRLPGKPIHRRTWELSETALVVTDQVEGLFDVAFAYFHLHPSIVVSANTSNCWVLHLPQGQRSLVIVEAGEASIVASHYSPEFGKRLETQCLKVALGPEGARVRIDWSSIE